MTAWRLPSLRGIARFLYVATHWETISEGLNKRDERIQAVEEWGRRMLRLQHEAHEAERRQFVRRVNEAMEAHHAAVEDAYVSTLLALAMMLYLEEAAQVRERMLELVPPGVRDGLVMTLERFREIEARGGPDRS